MTELEKIEYAKSFIDKLANGINPLDNTAIPDGDITNNVRLSRCFLYVSDILRQIIENGGIGKVEKSLPFAVTSEQLSHFEFSQFNISGSEIVKRLDSLVKNPLMKSLSVQALNKWLINEKLMYSEKDSRGKACKLPTPEGRKIGICTEVRDGRDGEYTAILFDTNAQHFIIDNMKSIIDTQVIK